VSHPCEERKDGAPLLALIPCIVNTPYRKRLVFPPFGSAQGRLFANCSKDGEDLGHRRE
jgi:hypothetical protein